MSIPLTAIIPTGALRYWLSFLAVALASIPALSQDKTETSGPDVSGGSTPDSYRGLVRSDKAAERWFLKTLVAGYQKSGHTNATWDAQVLRLFKSFVEKPGLESSQSTNYWRKMGETAAEVAKAGCKDPAIDYIQLRVDSVLHPEPDAIRAAKQSSVAEQMDLSNHHEMLKAFASVRASQALKAAMPARSKQPPQINELRKNAALQLEKVVRDKSIPGDMIAEITELIMEALWLNPPMRDSVFPRIERPLNANWPDNSRLLLIQGRYYVQYAWVARGSDYADKVSDKGMELYFERLEKAERLLERAWELDPKNKVIALEMMTVELGQGKGRQRMELWFNRVMALDTNNYNACSAKLNYLDPKWHGSPRDMVAFGRQCVASTNWGGSVPYILVNAHETLVRYLPKTEQPNYWRQPEVWKDVRAACQKLLKTQNNDLKWRKRYSWHAYKAEQWKEFLEQAKHISKPEDYPYFGGKEAFDRMVQLAKEKIAQK